MTAVAQDYPQRTVKIIATEAGGSTDLVARSIGQKLAERWGQPVVVENRGGASGIIGAELAARAPADGYTIFIGHTGTLAINPAVHKALPYDPVRDYAPVTLVLATPLIVVAHPSFGARTTKELIELLRAKPGEIPYGSSGSGTASHLAAELLNHLAGTRSLHVPFRGTGPSTAALVAGNVSYMISAQAATLPLVRGGKLRAIAVTGAKRSAEAPELPTVSESGLAGFEVVNWQGVLVPAGVPRDIVAKLQSEIVWSLGTEEVKKRLLTGGAELVGSAPDAFGRFIQDEIRKWGAVVRAAGIKPD